MDKQLTEKEAMIIVAYANGKTFTEIADSGFGISHDTVGRIYQRAKPKFDAQAAAGLFSTEVEQ